MDDDDDDYKVSSELYAEHEYETKLKPTLNTSNVVSTFKFQIGTKQHTIDVDGDLNVQRKSSKDTIQMIEIEHSKSTILNLVGLQVWRGALLLADWLICNNENLPDKTILELGSGVGLTSIVASMYKPVLCTDINDGGILELIRQNMDRNKKFTNYPAKVMELNFMKEFSKELREELLNVEVVIAADVIYDDTITEAFVNVVNQLLTTLSNRIVYVALEKRYVFTVADCDSVAPCCEYFVDCLNKLRNVRVEEVNLNFPQYFQYERVKELVLWKITNS